MRLTQIFGCLFLIVVSVVLVGCGPKMGEVSGTVTLDGTPVSGAEVNFAPIDPVDPLNAGSGIGYTQPDGTYRIRFPGDKVGLPTGEYKVWINNAEVDFEGEEGEAATPVPQPIPNKYNQDASTLTATISSGENICDWELTSVDD